ALEEEQENLVDTNKRHVKKVAKLLEQVEVLEAGGAVSEGLQQDNDDLTAKVSKLERKNQTLQEAAEAASGDAAEVERLTREVERLERKVAEAPSSGAGGDDGMREEVASLFEDVNDLASGWRNDVALCQDFFAEIDEGGFDDSEARAEVFDGFRETLEALSETAQDMREKLREVRTSLDS
ncbi:MAG: hypothetical protein QF464_20715, partial [Myxococcota bacterium]|nr:hypothetical protein [Myxococcota bacterium]